MIFPYVLAMCLNLIHSFIILPHPFLYSLLRTVSAGVIVLYPRKNMKYISHVHSPSSSPFTLPLLLVPTPEQDLFFLPVLHFVKCVLIVLYYFDSKCFYSLCLDLFFDQGLLLKCIGLFPYFGLMVPWSRSILVCLYSFRCDRGFLSYGLGPGLSWWLAVHLRGRYVCCVFVGWRFQ